MRLKLRDQQLKVIIKYIYIHTYIHIYIWASLVAQTVKNLPAMRETWVRSLGWEDPLEEGMATPSSILAWRIPVDSGAWRATVHGVTNSWTQLSDSAQHIYIYISATTQKPHGNR